MSECNWSTREASKGKYFLPCMHSLFVLLLTPFHPILIYIYIRCTTIQVFIGQLLHEWPHPRICGWHRDEWMRRASGPKRGHNLGGYDGNLEKPHLFSACDYFFYRLPLFSLRASIKPGKPSRRISKLAIMKEQPGCSIWKRNLSHTGLVQTTQFAKLTLEEVGQFAEWAAIRVCKQLPELEPTFARGKKITDGASLKYSIEWCSLLKFLKIVLQDVPILT